MCLNRRVKQAFIEEPSNILSTQHLPCGVVLLFVVVIFLVQTPIAVVAGFCYCCCCCLIVVNVILACPIVFHGCYLITNSIYLFIYIKLPISSRDFYLLTIELILSFFLFLFLFSCFLLLFEIKIHETSLQPLIYPAHALLGHANLLPYGNSNTPAGLTPAAAAAAAAAAHYTNAYDFTSQYNQAQLDAQAASAGFPYGSTQALSAAAAAAAASNPANVANYAYAALAQQAIAAGATAYQP